ELLEVGRHGLDRAIADGVPVTAEKVFEHLRLAAEGDGRVDETHGFAVLGSGPATPVHEIPMSATHLTAVPTAICAATTGSTGRVSSRWSASTAARLDLRSVASVTSPPRATAEAPGTSTSEATNRPPVRDSADASDSPSRVQEAMIRLLVSRSSGSGTGSVPVGSGAASGTVRIRPGLPAEPLAVSAVRFRLTVELRRLHAVVDAGDKRDDD